jgi:hypothetical protein
LPCAIPHPGSRKYLKRIEPLISDSLNDIMATKLFHQNRAELDPENGAPALPAKESVRPYSSGNYPRT